MMQNMNPMNLNQQNLMMQNINPMNLNQQNLIPQGMINQMNFINNNDS